MVLTMGLPSSHSRRRMIGGKLTAETIDKLPNKPPFHSLPIWVMFRPSKGRFSRSSANVAKRKKDWRNLIEFFKQKGFKIEPFRLTSLHGGQVSRADGKPFGKANFKKFSELLKQWRSTYRAEYRKR